MREQEKGVRPKKPQKDEIYEKVSRVSEVGSSKKPQKDEIYEKVSRVSEVGSSKKPQKDEIVFK